MARALCLGSGCGPVHPFNAASRRLVRKSIRRKIKFILFKSMDKMFPVSFP
jgi:hypothetical protein